MLHVNYKKKYVGTYKEIAIMFVSFSIILLFLYPKDMISKQILSEKSNYDLSILYLKNMLKNDSSNEGLMLTLAEQSFNSGNKDLSFKLLELLKNSKDKERKSKAYLLSYQLAKSDYFYLKTNHKTEEKQAKYEELQRIYKTIIKEELYEEENIEDFYKEGAFLNDNPSSYFLIQKLLLKNPDGKNLLNDAYYLLRKMDGGTALDVLKRESKTSQYWQSKLIDFYIQNKQYNKASDVYITIFQKKKDYAIKKKFFIKAVKTLQSANQTKDAANLTKKYENFFFKDSQMRIEMLKIYIAAGELQKANSLSKRMLEGGNY